VGFFVGRGSAKRSSYSESDHSGHSPPAGSQVDAGQWSGANGHLPSLSIALIVLSRRTEHLVKWDGDSISNQQIDSKISCHLVSSGHHPLSERVR
jgi:hypothetical protein